MFYTRNKVIKPKVLNQNKFRINLIQKENKNPKYFTEVTFCRRGLSQ
jgi:hypothetical protein